MNPKKIKNSALFILMLAIGIFMYWNKTLRLEDRLDNTYGDNTIQQNTMKDMDSVSI